MMVVTFEQGWPFVEQSIIKLMNMLEVSLEPDFNSEDYMMAYTSIYHMSTQQPPYDYSKQLYNKYRETCELYISSVVLPSLREKHDEFMLRELVKRWTIHKAMVRWLSRFFHYLDRYYIARRSLPSLSEVGLTSFRDRVYKDIHGEVRDVVISLIDREREGQQIDRGLLKNVVNIFVEIGFGKMDYYENDFEAAMLKDTTAYYYWKASNWILEDAFHDFVIKIYQIVQREKDRVAHYLHSSSEQKLVENIRREFGVYATRLLEKEHSGSHASPMEDKVDDISRMNTLFSSISLGPDPVSNNT